MDMYSPNIELKRIRLLSKDVSSKKEMELILLRIEEILEKDPQCIPAYYVLLWDDVVHGYLRKPYGNFYSSIPEDLPEEIYSILSRELHNWTSERAETFIRNNSHFQGVLANGSPNDVETAQALVERIAQLDSENSDNYKDEVKKAKQIMLRLETDSFENDRPDAQYNLCLEVQKLVHEATLYGYGKIKQEANRIFDQCREYVWKLPFMKQFDSFTISIPGPYSKTYDRFEITNSQLKAERIEERYSGHPESAERKPLFQNDISIIELKNVTRISLTRGWHEEGFLFLKRKRGSYHRLSIVHEGLELSYMKDYVDGIPLLLAVYIDMKRRIELFQPSHCSFELCEEDSALLQQLGDEEGVLSSVHSM